MWLVEKEQIGTGHMSPGELGSPLHAMATSICSTVHRPRQTDDREIPLGFLGTDPHGLGNETKVFTQRQLRVEPRCVPDVADAMSDIESVVVIEWDAEHRPGAGRGAVQSRHDPEKGRLPSTVRPEESDGLTGGD